ncbi:MAG TPA: asparaginase [Micropepsaceae bacterium]|jgi:L-asparaginase II|nr:asparaginase [Micropepsaceae bacterium]
MTNPILVEVTRGPLVESIHRGAVAVSDAKGRLRLAIGDIERPIFPRSALKPIQAVPLVESGTADTYKLSDEELALACASHSGEPQHTSPIAAWQSRIGCSVADLACGPHRPVHEPTATGMIVSGERWTPLHNNCSGKHTGFMTLARGLGAPVAGYEQYEHPVQREVERTLKEMAGLSGPLPHGIDGCTVPNFALPLAALARAMAAFADPSTLPKARAETCARILSAMIAHPELVAGTGRPCTLLMRQAPGIAVKTGAEGVYVAILPALGFGVALKIDDGAGRAAETAIAAVLIALGALPDEGAAHALAHAPVLNTRGAIVGERRVLKEVLAQP